MNSSIFLSQLKKALENHMDAKEVQQQLDFYKNYIKEEMRQGKTEQEVLELLGDPWAIAKTLSYETKSQGTQYETVENENEQKRRHSHVFGLDTWWKKALLILGVLAIIFIIFSIVFGILSMIIPLVIPFLVVAVLIRFLKSKK